MDPMLISVVANLVLMVLLIVSESRVRKSRAESAEKTYYLDELREEFAREGGRGCCVCGKPYHPLNDPDYSPELNLCRDCMWKMYYSQTFGEEDIL